MAKRGIDISAHQGDINLEALKNQIDFIIIRVGYGTKGTIDNKFKRNADLCRSLGIPVGFYWYSYALDVNGAKQEADAFIKAITPYKDITKFGAWFDMEDADDYKKKNGMPSDKTLRDMCATFCEMVENAGFYAGIYASQSWFNDQLKGDEIIPYDKWIAQWPTSSGKQTALATSADKRTDVHLWQFTSVGKFEGYNGNLDTNYAYLDVFPNPGQSTSVSKSKPTLTSKPEPTPSQSITKGSKVKFTGTKSYSGITLASWTKNDIFDVIEVSGDRVVIGKGTAVTAAVNVKNCKKV